MKHTIVTTYLLAALAAGLAHAGTPLPTPVHQWSFDVDGSDSGTGNIAMQFNGNGTQDFVFTRSGGGSIKLDKTLSADGATSESPVDLSGFSPGQTRTIAFWMKAPAGQEIFATMVGLGINGLGQRFDIRLQADSLRVEIQGAGQATSALLADNEWHHVAIVVPDTSPAATLLGDVLFYVDGVSVPNPNGQTQTMNTATAVVQLGDSTQIDARREYDGWLDDVRIYNVALDAVQIASVIAETDAGGPSVTGFGAEQDSLFAGDSTNLVWDAFALGGADTLQITNDQDATVIDAAAATGGNTGTSGLTLVSPVVTTVYTMNLNGSPVGSVTVTVKTTPDLLSFQADPDFLFGAGGGSTLSWTTALAQRLVINDGSSDVATFTLSGDGQAFLDSGTWDATNITSTTTFTLTGYLDEAGAGTPGDIMTTVTVQPEPDLFFSATPTVSDGTVPATLSWSATVLFTEVQAGIFETVSGSTLTDNEVNFDAVLDPSARYVLEVTTGNNAGLRTNVVSFSGMMLITEDDLSGDLSWTGDYIIDLAGGADLLEIDDDGTAPPLFSTTDPLVIEQGNFTTAGPVTTTTIFTATATITGAGTATANATVDTTGTGSTYEETVLADSPLAYYRFEEPANTTIAFDSSGNNNHSTSFLGNVVRGEAGGIGSSYLFDGNETVTTGVTLNPQDPDGDDSQSPAPDEDPDNIEGWSLEAIVHAPVTTGLFNQHIAANQDGTGLGRSNFYILNSGALGSFVGGGTSAGAQVIADDSWCHVAMTCTYDPATFDYTIRFYLDGQLDAEILGVTPEAATGLWVIGSHKIRSPGGFFVGNIDEWAIYDYSLDDPDGDGIPDNTRILAHAEAFATNTGIALLGFTATDSQGNPDGVVGPGVSAELKVKVGPSATTVEIDNGVGPVSPVNGYATIPVSPPTGTTTYTLTVNGTEMRSADVTVLGRLDAINPTFTPPSTFSVTGINLVPGVLYDLFGGTDAVTFESYFLEQAAPATSMLNFSDTFADPVTFPTQVYRIEEVVPE